MDSGQASFSYNSKSKAKVVSAVVDSGQASFSYNRPRFTVQYGQLWIAGRRHSVTMMWDRVAAALGVVDSGQASFSYNASPEAHEPLTVVDSGQASFSYNSPCLHPLGHSLWIAGRRHSVTIRHRYTAAPRALWIAGRRHSVTIRSPAVSSRS